MEIRIALLLIVATCATLLQPHPSAAQTAPAIPAAITTPDTVQTRSGTLDFKDGMPSKETLAKVYDNLDFTHAFDAFVNTFQGVNAVAARKEVNNLLRQHTQMSKLFKGMGSGMTSGMKAQQRLMSQMQGKQRFGTL